jgi:hypothetical protein
MELTVITAITNGKDDLKPIDNPELGVKYVCFTDDLDQDPKGWELRKVCDKFTPILNAKIHKVLIHKYIKGNTIWIDGSVHIKGNVKDDFEKYTQDYDIAVYSHDNWCNRQGLTIYEEAQLIEESGKEDPIKVHEILAHNEYPQGRSLPVCTVIFRKDTQDNARNNERWWSEICRWSNRDQLSFPYVYKEYKEIPGKMQDIFNINKHK